MGKRPYDRKNFKYDDNLIFYSRLNDDNAPQKKLWQKVYSDANAAIYQKTIKNMPTIKEIKEIGNGLIAAGLKEREKEIGLLQTVNFKQIPINEKDYTKYINALNKVIGMRDDYENLLKLAKTKATGKELGRGMATFLGEYLLTSLNQNLKKMIQPEIEEKNGEFVVTEKWKTQIEKCVKDSVYEAVLKVSNQTENIDGEEVLLWKRSLAPILENKDAYDFFEKTLLTTYHLDTIIDTLVNYINGTGKFTKTTTGGKEKNLTFREVVGKHMKIEKKSGRTKAGFINEFSALMNDGIQIDILSGKKVNIKSEVARSNIPTIDSVTLYDTTFSIDMDKIISEISINALSGLDKIDVANNLQKYIDKNLSKLEGLFVEFTNTKLYSLGDSFDSRGFGGGSTSFSVADEIFKKWGYKNTGELIGLLKNCAEGAIGYRYKKVIEQNMTLMLSQHVAKFLFDDWEQIGVSGPFVHIFNLNQIKVPLSYLLITMGKALSEAATYYEISQYFSVVIKAPKILYPLKVGITSDGQIDESTKDFNMKAYWDHQAEKGMLGTIETRFLANFKTLLNELIDNL